MCIASAGNLKMNDMFRQRKNGGLEFKIMIMVLHDRLIWISVIIIPIKFIMPVDNTKH